VQKIITLGCLAFIVCTLSACAVPIRSVDKTVRQSDIPPIGETQTAELGAKLVLQQDVEVVRGKKLTQVTRGSLGIFPADYEGMYVRANGGEHYCGKITMRDLLNNGKQNMICFTAQEMSEKKELPFIDAEDIVQRPSNLQRMLEYSGKSANTLSIFYKEFNETNNGAFIRPAFTQEFKFDLGEGNVIGIKGARIEVIQATNTGITYKVLAHFPR
jgi:hypothetical protein